MGVPAYFIASFGAGMSLADTYGISGGDYSPWARVLYVVSLGSFVGAVTLAIFMARGPRRSTAASPDLRRGAVPPSA